MIRSRPVILTIVSLTIIAALVLSILVVNNLLPSNNRTFLKNILFPLDWHFQTLCHSYWNDLLEYTDGYELWVVQGDNNRINNLLSWNTDSITLDEAESILGRPFNYKAKSILQSMSQNGPFIQWAVIHKTIEKEKWLLLIDDSGVLTVYRAHHLR